MIEQFISWIRQFVFPSAYKALKMRHTQLYNRRICIAVDSCARQTDDSLLSDLFWLSGICYVSDLYDMFQVALRATDCFDSV
jgi:hypothetical protein